MIEISRYNGTDREAVVFKNEKVYVVEMLMRGRVFKKTVVHNIDMAEDLAENFVGDSIGGGPTLLNE
jgi:hypothetical protein